MMQESDSIGGSPSLAQVLESIPQNVSPQQLKGINATVHIKATGNEPADWVLAIKDGVCVVELIILVLED